MKILEKINELIFELWFNLRRKKPDHTNKIIIYLINGGLGNIQMMFDLFDKIKYDVTIVYSRTDVADFISIYYPEFKFKLISEIENGEEYNVCIVNWLNCVKPVIKSMIKLKISHIIGHERKYKHIFDKLISYSNDINESIQNELLW